jgi:hypothetical protein
MGLLDHPSTPLGNSGGKADENSLIPSEVDG